MCWMSVLWACVFAGTYCTNMPVSVSVSVCVSVLTKCQRTTLAESSWLPLWMTNAITSQATVCCSAGLPTQTRTHRCLRTHEHTQHVGCTKYFISNIFLVLSFSLKRTNSDFNTVLDWLDRFLAWNNQVESKSSLKSFLYRKAFLSSFYTFFLFSFIELL